MGRKEIEDDGYDVGMNYGSSRDNPHLHDTEERKWWLDGFIRATIEVIRSLISSSYEIDEDEEE